MLSTNTATLPLTLVRKHLTGLHDIRKVDFNNLYIYQYLNIGTGWNIVYPYLEGHVLLKTPKSALVYLFSMGQHWSNFDVDNEQFIAGARRTFK